MSSEYATNRGGSSYGALCRVLCAVLFISNCMTRDAVCGMGCALMHAMRQCACV